MATSKKLHTSLLKGSMLIFLCCLLLFPAHALTGAKNGLLLWFNQVLPSILPFLILSTILLSTGVSDSIAIGVMNAAAAQGIQIGSELSVMGFDNTAVSEVCSPPLTTVSQPRADIGHTAIQLLSKKLTEKCNKNSKVFLPHEIIIRASTGPVIL